MTDLCCDHPFIRLRWQTRPDGSKGPWWLSCACGSFTDYAPTPGAAWALQSALSSSPARQLPSGVLPAAGASSSEVS